MKKKKQSFFQRLTGVVNPEPEEMLLDDDMQMARHAEREDVPLMSMHSGDTPMMQDSQANEEAELAVDVFEDQENIVIQTMLAGVDPDDLNVSITRDMVTIKGARLKTFNASKDAYFHEELYWGGFSRAILLPAEVVVEDGSAEMKNGLLTVTLPKIDKDRETKLKVRVAQ